MTVHASALTRNTMRQPYGTASETRGTTEFGSFMALSRTKYLGHGEINAAARCWCHDLWGHQSPWPCSSVLLPSGRLPFACRTIKVRRQPGDEGTGWRDGAYA